MSHSTFDDRLNSYILPPPGPEYYAVRRAIWLLPREQSESPSRLPVPPTLQRLEAVLSAPGAVSDDKLWQSSLESIWSGLSSGGIPKHSIPMNLVVKLIHAAWLRDSTWPPGASAPEPDDTIQADGDGLGRHPPLIRKSCGATDALQTTPSDSLINARQR